MVTRPGHTGGYGVGHRLPGIDHMPLRNRAEGRRERLAHREADAGSRHVGVTREAHVILLLTSCCNAGRWSVVLTETSPSPVARHAWVIVLSAETP